MNVDKKVNAKVRSDGALVVKLDEQPSCMQVIADWTEVAVRYVFTFFAGMLVGILVNTFWN